MPASVRRLESAAICERLAGIPELRSASHVALFSPLADEVMIDALAAHPAMAGHTLCLPRMRDDGCLDFVATPADAALVPGRHGVREPSGQAGTVAMGEGDVVVLPALAFDRQGVRLGRGGGYYDRSFPPAVHRPFLVGVSFSQLLVERLPREDHDLSVDAIVTGEELWRPAASHSR